MSAALARAYSDPDCRTFVHDMEAVGLEPFHYNGRYFWEGPAVSVDDLQDALGATRIKCQFDALGLGFVVYPRASDRGKVVE